MRNSEYVTSTPPGFTVSQGWVRFGTDQRRTKPLTATYKVSAHGPFVSTAIDLRMGFGNAAMTTPGNAAAAAAMIFPDNAAALTDDTALGHPALLPTNHKVDLHDPINADALTNLVYSATPANDPDTTPPVATC